MNKNAQRYYQSALSLHLPARLLPDIEGFVIALGRRQYYFRGACTPFNSHVSGAIANNKYCTSLMLQRAGFPVPKSVVINAYDMATRSLDDCLGDLTFPLVAKPTIDTSKGQDVLCNITTIEQLRNYVVTHLKKHEFITIETFHGGLNSYRVLVFKNKVLGVVWRFAAAVTGDGIHTISELIEITNQKRAAANDILKPIVMDEECHICLDAQGLNLGYIPKPDEAISLGYTTNTTRGGTVMSLDTRLCKSNEKYFVKAAKVLGIELAGFDVLCDDIFKPVEQLKGVILEVNPTPSIRIHEEFATGKAVNVTKRIVRRLIYRHPVSYLMTILNKKTVQLYSRMILLIGLVVGIIWFLN